MKHSQSIVDAIPTAALIVDMTGQIVVANSVFHELLELLPAQALALRFPDEILTPVSISSEHQWELLRSGRRVVLSASMKRRISEETIDLQVSMSPVHCDAQDVVIVGIRDVTERRDQQQELVKHQTILSCLLDSIPDLVFCKDMEGRYLTCNEQFAGYAGLSVDSIVGKTDFELFDDETAKRYRENDRQAIDAGIGRRNEEWIQMPDGSRTYLDTYKAPLRTPSGAIIGVIGVSRDMTERHRQESKLRYREACMKSLLDNSPYLLWLKDIDGHFLAVNKPFAESCGAGSPESLLGKTDFDIWPTDLAEKYVADDRVVMSTKQKRIAEELIADRDPPGWFETYKSPIFSDDGEVVGTTGIAQDISERRRYVEELKKAKEFAEAGALAKNHFLANMSHEIRTPMNGILGMSQILLEMGLDKEARECAQSIVECGRSLLTIINDILDFSKLEAGKYSLSPVSFSLETCVENAVDLLREQITSSGKNLRVEISPQLPRAVIADDVRIRQVLLNLLSNAAKFTRPNDTILVKVDLALSALLPDTSSECVAVRFVISDSGIGIAQDQLQRIFEPFTQADETTSRHFGGTGLGLAISKTLVELMGGHIWAESLPDAGSTFFVVLPLVPDQAKNQAAASERPEQQPVTRSLRVLLVEDNIVNQKIVVNVLKRLGHAVKIAGSGKVALEIVTAAETPFDLILMDGQMPEMDGFECTRAIRSREIQTSAHIPIVAMTALAMEGDKERCLEAGMDDYIAKPISIEHLRAVLAKFSNDPSSR